MKELKHGDPIPGSKYFRSFCSVCGDPIRVSHSELNRSFQCDSCRSPKTATSDYGGGRADRAYHGDQFESGEW